MKSKTAPFVLIVAVAALAVALNLQPVGPDTAREEIVAVLLLASFGLIAELLDVVLPRGATGSMAALPLLGLSAISPTWHSVLAVVVVKSAVELIRRRGLEKAIFNVSLYALSMGLGAFVFTALGGTSLLALRDEPIATVTRLVGLPAFTAFFASMAANSLLVSAVVALARGTPFGTIWRVNILAVIAMEVLSTPLIFVFAWVYVRFGAVIAASAWVPIIGIRHAQITNLALVKTNEELLELMIKSIEARDAYTSGHSRRVQTYSTQVARALGLSERDVSKVGKAALLHDVGKIHEKYGPILRKADRLTAEEWATMKEHPADGAELITTMTHLRELVSAVRHHHENWDGTGYPDGLAGELIPLPARIIRFADTIDAMTTERPYRRAMTPEHVRAEIIRCRGTQFDPQMVDRLLSSPAWKTMFVPSPVEPVRFGELAVVATPRSEKVGAYSA